MASNRPTEPLSTPEPPKRPSDSEENVLERTGYDPNSKARSFMNIFRGRMSKHGQQLMMMDLEYENEEKDCARCEKTRDYLLTYSPIIRFLNERITDLNGGNLASKIECQRCITRIEDRPNGEKAYLGQAGGFSPGHGILICANKVRDQSHQQDVMAHEMVHAWDHLRWKVDWNDLRHAACTEIRASTLSGECRWTQEFFKRGQYRITQQFQNCVRRRAILSVMARPRCKDDVMAAKVVNEVFDSCFNDTRPFDEVYK